MYMCVHIYIQMHVHIYIYIYVYVHTYIYMFICIYVYTYIFLGSHLIDNGLFCTLTAAETNTQPTPHTHHHRSNFPPNLVPATAAAL